MRNHRTVIRRNGSASSSSFRSPLGGHIHTAFRYDQLDVRMYRTAPRSLPSADPTLCKFVSTPLREEDPSARCSGKVPKDSRVGTSVLDLSAARRLTVQLVKTTSVIWVLGFLLVRSAFIHNGHPLVFPPFVVFPSVAFTRNSASACIGVLFLDYSYVESETSLLLFTLLTCLSPYYTNVGEAEHNSNPRCPYIQ